MHEPVSFSLTDMPRAIMLKLIFKHHNTTCSLSIYLRGAGGFSKSSQPYSYSTNRNNQSAFPKIPKSQPFAVYEECTHASQVGHMNCLLFSMVNCYAKCKRQYLYLECDAFITRDV